jgi:hypothetical protein
MTARRLPLLVTLTAAAASLAFVLYAGRHNSSPVLPVLFVAWVLAPFAAMVWMLASPKRKPGSPPRALSSALPIIALGTLAAYAFDALRPHKARAAAVFLLVPAVSWLALGAVALWMKRQR